jgi:N-acetylglucosamine malate deacetylase 1
MNPRQTINLHLGILLQENLMPKIILVVAAHADDEVLGCGGSIARHVGEGDIVYAVFMADGVSSRLNHADDDSKVRHVAAERARHVLGISKNYYLGLPDNRLDSLPLIDVVQRLELIIEELRPEVIYTHHLGDLNIDHRITHQVVMTACRPVPSCSVREIYAFEVMSSTEWGTSNVNPFCPDYFIDVSDYLNVKMAAIQAYALEMRNPPHSRSLLHLECLARHRGYSVGLPVAEAFMLIRATR